MRRGKGEGKGGSGLAWAHSSSQQARRHVHKAMQNLMLMQKLTGCLLGAIF